MDVGGPSVMSMYEQVGPTGPNPDLGQTRGGDLLNREFRAQTEYAAPSTFGPQRLRDNAGVEIAANAATRSAAGIPQSYNMYEPYPVKYTAPSGAAERIKDRVELRKAAGNPAATGARTQIVDNISEDEVNYLGIMKRQAELADFDRYVNSLIDVRQPGNLKWLMEVYPDFVGRRLEQVRSDYDYAVRNQMIDSWGINTFDDLHFKYLVDQGKIDGPRLGRQLDLRDQYTPGLLSPYTFKMGGDSRGRGLRLPFASATIGARPPGNDPNNWRLADGDGAPMSTGRTTQELVSGIYDKADYTGRQALYAQQPRNMARA